MSKARHPSRTTETLQPIALRVGKQPRVGLEPVAEFDFFARAESYGLAHQINPTARQNELGATLEFLGPLDGLTIVEIGAGQGFLTRSLAQRCGLAGRVVAVDNSEQQLASLQASLPGVECIRASSERLPVPSGSADVVVSLANFHHITDKMLAFAECARVLRPGGRFVLVDICGGTPMQRYFDEVVDKVCSTGHRHSFLDRETCQQLATVSELSLRMWELTVVPWQFPSPESGGLFLKRIHDAWCAPEMCWREASAHLGASNSPTGQTLLHWQLFFMLAVK